MLSSYDMLWYTSSQNVKDWDDRNEKGMVKNAYCHEYDIFVLLKTSIFLIYDFLLEIRCLWTAWVELRRV